MFKESLETLLEDTQVSVKLRTIFPPPQECEDSNTRGTAFLKSHGMCVHVPTSLCLFEMHMPKTSQQCRTLNKMQTQETGKTATTPKAIITAPVSRKAVWNTWRNNHQSFHYCVWMKRQKLINTESARDYFSNLDQVKADFESYNGRNQMKVRTNRLSRSQWKLEALDLCRLNYDLMT